MLRSWTLGLFLLPLGLVAACGGRTPLNPYDDGGPPDVAVTCDRDGDGYLGAACDGVDCNDLDRAVHPGVAERCFDGVDNNCNGAVDCADSSCAGIPECSTCVPGPERDCFNGVDDDCNGQLDCDDRACARNPRCGGVCLPGPELDCFNGIDDDCNGAFDCGDPACAGNPECGMCRPGPELDCFNGIDDDCNGAFDCDDPACAREPACGACEPRPEVCNNGIDDDCDGAPDCGDRECAGTMACSGRSCPTANLGMRLGDALATGSTVGAANSFTGGCGDGSSERTFQWTAPTSNRFIFDTAGSRFDTVLYLMTDCGGTPVPGACNDDAGSTQAQLGWDLRAGQRVIVVVDGFGGDQGNFVLSIRRGTAFEQGPDCFNGADDDGDGLVDCGDPDCGMEPGCSMTCTPGPERLCNNGIDDDCDGAPDCMDRDCAMTPACGGTTCVPERCGNGIDDDCDRLVDCADPDCAGTPICGSTTDRELGVAACTNGRDDDGDGRIDCADPDCSPLGSGPDNECCNGIDDNGDGQVDEFTCRCFNDSQCAGVGTLDQVCWTGTFHVCAPRCDFYGGDTLCSGFFGAGWTCVGTQCLPPGGGGPPPPVPGGTPAP